ncbi:hypothetical protein DENSPDRAFT_2226 [Dentipellis sp. KUC8613]|nr:hypothetical protein DENSPDRAFT_2226 [Dentipellis sp. KUC8613]
MSLASGQHNSPEIQSQGPPACCPVCGNTFTRKADCERHQEGKHPSGLKPKSFDCTQCDRTFAQKTQLKTHMNTRHSSESHYKCNICDERFRNPPLLTKHKKKAHNHQVVHTEEWYEKKRLQSLGKVPAAHTTKRAAQKFNPYPSSSSAVSRKSKSSKTNQHVLEVSATGPAANLGMKSFTSHLKVNSVPLNEAVARSYNDGEAWDDNSRRGSPAPADSSSSLSLPSSSSSYFSLPLSMPESTTTASSGTLYEETVYPPVNIPVQSATNEVPANFGYGMANLLQPQAYLQQRIYQDVVDDSLLYADSLNFSPDTLGSASEVPLWQSSSLEGLGDEFVDFRQNSLQMPAPFVSAQPSMANGTNYLDLLF